MTGRPFDAVLVIAFGGPEGPADIRPFLASNPTSATIFAPRGRPGSRLYDLDHEAAAVCSEADLTMVRAEAVNDAPRFLDTMAGAVMQTWNRYRSGIPLSLAPVSPPTRVEGPPPFRSAPPAA